MKPIPILCTLVAAALFLVPVSSFSADASVRTFQDIPYVEDGHERQKLDLYLPEGEGRHPVIVWIHGGAWRAGSKDRTPATRYVDEGFAVASINYRFSQHALFPAQIEDCKAAIRWLRTNADRHGLDPDRFAAWGASAGGHLSALVGTTGNTDLFDVGANQDQSSAVQAVIDFFGPTDFRKMNQQAGDLGRMDHDAEDSPESRLIGGAIQVHPEEVRRANPITYVDSEDPPFLIVHGDQDPLVAIGQSEILNKALEAADIPVRMYAVKGGGHGGFQDPEVGRLVTEFLKRHLKQ